MYIGDFEKSRLNNFTLLRIFASLTVLFAHSFALSTGKHASDPVTRLLLPYWQKGIGDVALDIFFIISGFLVSASYIHRKNLLSFVEARMLRIFPGLIVMVLLTVVVLGPLVTTFTVSDYFQSKVTTNYLFHNTTLVFGIHYRLPGVFLDNTWANGVNGSLWTLPVEVYMYCFLAVIGALGILLKRETYNLLFAVVCVFFLYTKFQDISFILGKARHIELAVIYLTGGFFYVNRHHIPLNAVTLFVLMVAFAICNGTLVGPLVKLFFFTYLTLFFALHPAVQLPPLDKYGDYSYGIYIYAFPVQQAISFYWHDIPSLAMFFIALPIVFAFSYFSWMYIEKPSLRLKGRIPMARRWLDPRAVEPDE